ncbi:hypothetical protein Pfo_024901, partial [Paulownia fortunei]
MQNKFASLRSYEGYSPSKDSTQYHKVHPRLDLGFGWGERQGPGSSARLKLGFGWGASDHGSSATPRRHSRAPVASYCDGLSPQKINLISCEPLAHVSDIKLIRTDTTLDL